ncbi:MAG: MinD/ParA family protein [Pirellulales bacterium]|nr:MinD/ParA family protein [Pirellulales bacterium]
MSVVVAIHSFRGGTGKSNTTANLAALIAQTGKRVGIIDTDIQSPGIHVIFGLSADKIRFALNDFLWGKCRIQEAAYDVTAVAVPPGAELSPRAKIYLIPSSVRSGEIARVLREGYDVGKLNDGIQQLVTELELDYLFIDTHPGVNEETLLSIAISDKFLLIMRPDNQDFQGTAVTVELAHRLEVREILLIINKVPQGLDRDALKTQIESTYRAPVIGMLPLNTEMASLASSGIFTTVYPNHPFSLELRRIAARLAE